MLLFLMILESSDLSELWGSCIFLLFLWFFKGGCKGDLKEALKVK